LKNNNRRFVALAITSLLIIFIAILSNKQTKQTQIIKQNKQNYSREFYVFATMAKITFYTDKEKFCQAAEEITVQLQQLHNCINIFNKNSELSKLNQTAYQKPVICSKQLWQIIIAARNAYKKTDGAFDISVGPLLKLWGVHVKQNHFPSKQKIKKILPAIGLNKIIFNDKTHSVKFTHPETYLDFSGIAKGYALDIVRNIAKKYAIKKGLINLGGNIYCFSTDNTDSFSIGLTNPLNPKEIYEVIKLTNQAIATSGNYEQIKKIDNKRVQHIINPKTGYPVENVASVTVVTDSGVDSDIFSTAIFVAGKTLAQKFVDKSIHRKVFCILINNDGSLKNKNYSHK